MRSSKGTNRIDITAMSVDKLVNYLADTLQPNIKSAISRFNVYIKTIIKVDSDIHPEVKKISILLQELTNQMDQHLAMEEHLLFPYVEVLSKNQGIMSSMQTNLSEIPFKRIKEEHSKIINNLENIRKISNNYLPSVNSSPALKLCYAQLFDFEQDIHRHIFLEEKILFPKLLEIEKRDNSQKKNDTNGKEK